ncbi:MAG TPA: multicopper oxidase domain-containing protein [Candidatus Polarisedimenticolaceae bacterium]|nr:multicopper oxidase domain-containing protein [Candidatus Polarisedimenticolaceae bacterium]
MFRQPSTRTFASAAIAAGLVAVLGAVALAATRPAPSHHDTEVGIDGLDLRPYHNDTVGETTSGTLDPDKYLTATAPSTIETLADGRTLRTFEIHAVDKTIEIAPGVFFNAWTYEGQVPGPTLRATAGERIRIHFVNLGTRPHSMHFHGFHAAEMDGAMPHQQVPPGSSFTYEFDADPVGVHLYHCHNFPLTEHIHNGLYGLWIVDPRDGRAPARELYMMMNAFDPNYDEENEIYAVNSVAFHYAHHPIEVRQNELVRIYLANITEFDAVNSFHIHATFFDYYPTGTQRTPRDYTDTVILGQAERGIVEVRFPYTGDYMFHAHKTEFSERGWMGLFRVLPAGASRG